MSKRTSTTKKTSRQHQDFDKVLKKTFDRVYTSLIQKLLGIDLAHTVKIPSTFSKTKEKRADFAVKIQNDNTPSHIVHVEFQGRNDDKMHIRELGYYHDFVNEFGLEIVQYVIYMGTSKHKMIDHIKHKNLDFSYKIISLNEIDVQLFLNSDNPHELILAILCHFNKKDAPIIIHKILEKLKLKAQNERELFEYTTDLEILSGLRNLQSETKKQIDIMPITYDITKDLRFIEGEQKGKLEGKLEGKIEGKIEGKLEGELKKSRTATINLLKERLLSVDIIARVLDVPLAFVKKIQDELAKNPNLTE